MNSDPLRLQIEEHDEESGATRTIDVDPGQTELRVGRDRANDLVLASPSSSRRHCTFLRKPEGWFVVDLGSTLGTFCNGAKLTPNEPQPLANGDTVTCSTHQLRVTLMSAADSTLSRDPEAFSRLIEGLGEDATRAPRLWLFAGVATGSSPGRAYPLPEEGSVLTIGRSAECDIRLEDPFRVVSAVHARFERNWAGVFLFDASINGIYVNGTRVGGQTQVRDGDRITIASAEEGSERPLVVFADAGNEAVPAGPRGSGVLPGPSAAPRGGTDASGGRAHDVPLGGAHPPNAAGQADAVSRPGAFSDPPLRAGAFGDPALRAGAFGDPAIRPADVPAPSPADAVPEAAPLSAIRPTDPAREPGLGAIPSAPSSSTPGATGVPGVPGAPGSPSSDRSPEARGSAGHPAPGRAADPDGAIVAPLGGAASTGRPRVNWILIAVIAVSALALATVLVWGLVLLRG